jgi:hypothetical protein
VKFFNDSPKTIVEIGAMARHERSNIWFHSRARVLLTFRSMPVIKDHAQKFFLVLEALSGSLRPTP